MKQFIILMNLFIATLTFGQAPSISFTFKDNVCKEEGLGILNQSTNQQRMEWDFCVQDMESTPSATHLITSTSLNGPYSIELLKESGQWYGFIPSRNNDAIYLAEFSQGLKNPPTLSSLGSFDNNLSGPSGISFLDSSKNYYAYTTNLDNESIIRLDFGNSLTNTPTYQNLGNFGQIVNPDGIKIINDELDSYKLLVTYGSTVAIIDFGDQPTSSGTISSFVVPNASRLWGIDLYKDAGNWYGLISSFSNGRVFHLNFGANISTTPTISELPNGGYSFGSPADIRIIKDHENYYGVFQARNGQVYKYSFGTSLSNTSPNVAQLGNFGLFGTNCSGLFAVRDSSEFLVLNTEFTTHRINVVNFKKDCGLENDVYYESNPRVSLAAAGTYPFTITAYNDSTFSESYDEVTVTTNTAPPISFTDNNNECLGQANTFTPSDMGLASYEWSFDGGVTSGFSSTADTTHTFSQVGDSIVFLTVSDGTCSNFVKDTISIYPVPTIPTFSTPGAPYCTGADLAFENLFDESNYNGATLTYDWNYNSEGNTNERDGTFAFDSEGTKTITLTATIPGCSTPSAGTDINVIAGPDVGFSFEDLCLEDETQFHNSTTGTGITGQTWNFGDGSGTSSASSPTYSYAAHGNYDVSLTVNNNQGCSNELTLPITIDDKPVASFNHGPACEGVDISFLDESSVDGLANITSHEWDFEGLGTSTNQNPNFTFDSQGSYDVELIVETSAGCRDTVTSTVNVLLAPAANFEVDLGCINTETIFLDKSEGDFSNPITQWIWTIDGSLASYSSSFGEVYNDAGDHTISLLVRSANSCQSVHNDNFTISELPVVDFTVEKACDNESTVFQDATNSSSAAIESYSWQFDNQGSSTSNPATYQFTSAGSYTVGLNIVDETGCEGSIQKTVTIHPSPTAIINASSDIGPAPLMIDFTDESHSTQSSFWLFGDEDESTSSQNNPQFTYTDEGDYTAQLISTNDLGCSDTTSLAITVADPILDLELVQISTEESEEKTSVSLTVRNSGNVILHGFDIRIDLDNNSSIFESYAGTITRGKSITYPLNFTFSSVGNNIGYTCITLLDRVEEFEDINIVNNESCIDFNQQLIIENSYPNPVRSTDTKIRFNMILPADGPVQIFLLDATGAILYQDTYMEAKAGLNSFFLDIYSFEQGMYFIKTVYDQNESTQRFVKM
ncbi:MAG: PKD domain-containing protein [Reichenbachiella sp.]|uniref:PKD domain-containing protein n=1 Tax=Reichenbachiella sp. TaxID=2184521 RepID=UPI0029673BC3|nr:PKD domain-containing protein [Reichenbachiella sp.]MDW3211705.1 PKD domain-containing protein [Reichenbachiella sp.]